MQRFIKNLLNPLVVLTMIAVVSAIAAFLPYAQVHWKTTYAAIVIIFVLGSAGVAYQMYGLYYRANTVRQINRLLAEGHQLILLVGGDLPGRFRDFPGLGVQDQEQYNRMADWCKRVEGVLMERNGEGYVSRLHFGGSNEQDKRSMTIWKMNHRLETLATFLAELDQR